MAAVFSKAPHTPSLLRESFNMEAQHIRCPRYQQLVSSITQHHLHLLIMITAVAVAAG